MLATISTHQLTLLSHLQIHNSFSLPLSQCHPVLLLVNTHNGFLSFSGTESINQKQLSVADPPSKLIDIDNKQSLTVVSLRSVFPPTDHKPPSCCRYNQNKLLVSLLRVLVLSHTHTYHGQDTNLVQDK